MSDNLEARRRTTWPTAAELQQAADTLRAAAPHLDGKLKGLADPVADLLDETANALAWLAPYRDNEPGYGIWETACRVARVINGTEAKSPLCGYAERHSSHTFMRMDVLFQCPGTSGTEGER